MYTIRHHWLPQIMSRSFLHIKIWLTLPKTNSSPMKMTGFPSCESLFQGGPIFRGELLVSRRVWVPENAISTWRLKLSQVSRRFPRCCFQSSYKRRGVRCHSDTIYEVLLAQEPSVYIHGTRIYDIWLYTTLSVTESQYMDSLSKDPAEDSSITR